MGQKAHTSVKGEGMELEGQPLRTIAQQDDATLAEALRQWCFRLWVQGHELFPVRLPVPVVAGEFAGGENGAMQITLPAEDFAIGEVVHIRVGVPADVDVTEKDDTPEPPAVGEDGGFEAPAQGMTGLELYQWRQEHGHISQATLGSVLGIRAQCISDMENKKRPIPADMREQLARVERRLAKAERA